MSHSWNSRRAKHCCLDATRVHELECKLTCARNNRYSIVTDEEEGSLNIFFTNSTLPWNTFKQGDHAHPQLGQTGQRQQTPPVQQGHRSRQADVERVNERGRRWATMADTFLHTDGISVKPTAVTITQAASCTKLEHLCEVTTRWSIFFAMLAFGLHTCPARHPRVLSSMEPKPPYQHVCFWCRKYLLSRNQGRSCCR